ncbi:MAG: ribulose 1,5-bisphosphate carboxylase [Armatimonadetes bacterium]|nr:ribulose 1,5-bisphosphate carboxylase [Armatimonadota bacterium]
MSSPPVPPSLTETERGFLAPPSADLSADHVLLDYLFETDDDPLKAALHLCREQSTALWNRPGVDEDYRPRHAAKLVDLKALEPRPGSRSPRRARMRVAHPEINFGPRIPNLLTVACGEGAYFTPRIDVIRLEDIHFSAGFLAAFQGPRFGLHGVRELLGLQGRPIITGVIKPNIGLAIEPFAQIGYEGLRGGADIVKDDEMLADPPYSPIRERAPRVLELTARAASETGEGKLFIANITDEVENLIPLHDFVHQSGGRHAAVMLNAWCVGLSACRMVARNARVPLVSHFDFIAAFTRVPWHGVSELASTRLLRLAGFDMIIMPGLGGRMHQSHEEVLDSMRACLEPWGDIKPSLPIPGGSDWAGSLKPMLDTIGHTDFSIVCGRGIFGHPDGPAAGARSVREAWEAIQAGLDPATAAFPALRRAWEAFG